LSGRRSSGDSVVWRSRPGGATGYVVPCVVVADTARVTVLFQPAGVVCKRRSGKRGGPQGRSIIEWDGTYADEVWPGPPSLRLYAWGSSFSVIRAWNFERDCAEGWYVNLESPWQRTAIGFDSEDLILDVTATDDLSSWAWKDVDELDWAVEAGKVMAAEAELRRAIGREAIELLENRQWPFVDDWSAWRPHAQWPIPSVPPGWDDPLS
jgi:hypothetical protein